MPRLNDLPRGECVTLLLYGSAGSGKTIFCGTAGNRTLFINIGNGIESLQSKWFKSYCPNSNPIIETIIEDRVPSIAAGFDLVCDTVDKYIKDSSKDFDTIIIDDVTALRRMAMNKGLEINQTLNRSKTKSLSRDVIIPTVQDYGVEMNLIDQFIGEYTTSLREKGKHFIMTAHERITYKKGPNIGDIPTIHKISPGFTGQTFPDSVTGMFDLTWHMEAVGSGTNTIYRVRTQGDESLVAKTRHAGLFPTLYTNPKFLDVVNAVKTQIPLKGA